jgi:hypothetical protein
VVLLISDLTTAPPPLRQRRYGSDATNVLAVFIDTTYSSFDGSAWWYEGGGLTRGVDLVALPAGRHLDLEGAGIFPVASLPTDAARCSFLEQDSIESVHARMLLSVTPFSA